MIRASQGGTQADKQAAAQCTTSLVSRCSRQMRAFSGQSPGQQMQLCGCTCSHHDDCQLMQVNADRQRTALKSQCSNGDCCDDWSVTSTLLQSY